MKRGVFLLKKSPRKSGLAPSVQSDLRFLCRIGARSRGHKKEKESARLGTAQVGDPPGTQVREPSFPLAPTIPTPNHAHPPSFLLTLPRSSAAPGKTLRPPSLQLRKLGVHGQTFARGAGGTRGTGRTGGARPTFNSGTRGARGARGTRARPPN